MEINDVAILNKILFFHFWSSGSPGQKIRTLQKAKSDYRYKGLKTAVILAF
jgi:hypothetical protein